MTGRGERERGEVNREQTKSYIAQDKTLTFNVIGEIPYCLP
jgi:nitroimidazol reductase NimA-like FMN-containing flavoprotein (pyridoxamine 5'-phosphate oxidase superfamily)